LGQFPYNPSAPHAIPGWELNGWPAQAASRSGRQGAVTPGIPCSRLQSIRAFPEGLEGLGAGIVADE